MRQITLTCKLSLKFDVGKRPHTIEEYVEHGQDAFEDAVKNLADKLGYHHLEFSDWEWIT